MVIIYSSFLNTVTCEPCIVCLALKTFKKWIVSIVGPFSSGRPVDPKSALFKNSVYIGKFLSIVTN